jgi:hypothetical protein
MLCKLQKLYIMTETYSQMPAKDVNEKPDQFVQLANWYKIQTE